MIGWMNSCAFSLTIPSSVSHIGLLDAPWGPAISSLNEAMFLSPGSHPGSLV